MIGTVLLAVGLGIIFVSCVIYQILLHKSKGLGDGESSSPVRTRSWSNPEIPRRIGLVGIIVNLVGFGMTYGALSTILVVAVVSLILFLWFLYNKGYIGRPRGIGRARLLGRASKYRT